MGDVLIGKGKRLSLCPAISRSNETDSKKLFAECTDRVMWSKYLEKSTLWRNSKENHGEVPDEWTDAIDLLRGLTRLDPLSVRDKRPAAQLQVAKIHSAANRRYLYSFLSSLS